MGRTFTGGKGLHSGCLERVGLVEDIFADIS